jgi:hypothetical protein
MNDQMSYRAIDPGEDDEPSYPVDSTTIDRALDFRLEDNVSDVPPDLLTNASVRASWAALADFSGNMADLDRWAPAVMRRRLARQPRQRATFETPYGPARGTSVTMDLDGQRLRIRYAVDATIDQVPPLTPHLPPHRTRKFAQLRRLMLDIQHEVTPGRIDQLGQRRERRLTPPAFIGADHALRDARPEGQFRLGNPSVHPSPPQQAPGCLIRAKWQEWVDAHGRSA